MSGGSLSYLCYKEFPEICGYTNEMEEVEKCLLKNGYTDIAKDVRRLIEYIESARNRVEVLSENLFDVFHTVEWFFSGDIGDDTFKKHLEEYRRGKTDD